jgi:AraC-like DNA-binding protein
LSGYRELVRDLGGDPVRLLRRAGIDPAALNRLSALIAFESLIEVLEISSVALNCPDFGVRLAERQDIGILGMLGVAMRYSATVGEAMHCASKYLHFYNEAVGFTITTSAQPGQARLLFRVVVPDDRTWAQTAEHGIGLTCRILTTLSEGRCRLQQVRFPHWPTAPAATYQRHFGAPLTFRAEQPAVVIPAKDLRLPIDEHNQELRDVATGYLDRHRRADASFPAQVRQAVEALLGTSTCSYRAVAQSLHLHPRSMQRRLREEGTSFETIKDDTRRVLAETYLSQPEMPISQVASLLDYQDLSGLGRSCQRWFHTSARAFRDDLVSGKRPTRRQSPIAGSDGATRT